MSESNHESEHAHDPHQEEKREIAEVQEQLDGESEGDGLAAEAGRGEENGLSEG